MWIEANGLSPHQPHPVVHLVSSSRHQHTAVSCCADAWQACLVVRWDASCGGVSPPWQTVFVTPHGRCFVCGLSGRVQVHWKAAFAHPEAGSCLGSLGRCHLSLGPPASLAWATSCVYIGGRGMVGSEPCSALAVSRCAPASPCTVGTPAWVAQMPAANPSHLHCQQRVSEACQERVRPSPQQ